MSAGLSLDAAFRRIDAALAGRRLPVETVPARGAVGRVLARSQASRLDLPPFDKSAMDGYAVPEMDPRGPLRVTGTIAAGRCGKGPLRSGTAVKVMTGAPVPRGTRRVIMVEDAEEVGGLVTFTSAGGPDHICRRAEDVQRGAIILPKGRRLAPLDVANLIGCGVTRIPVARRPKVAILATGDEIVDHPERLRPGRIMNSNGPLLEGLCAVNGLEVVSSVRVPDRLEALVDALRRACARADIVVLSGGVSVGDFDLVPRALCSAGLRVRFARVAVKPGRPATFATGGRRIVFGLPGNPVSVFVAFHLLVLRAAARLMGATAPGRSLKLPLARPFRRRRAGRLELVPARLTPEGRLEFLESHGSADLLSLTAADGMAMIGASVRAVGAGSQVDFLPLSVRWP